MKERYVGMAKIYVREVVYMEMERVASIQPKKPISHDSKSTTAFVVFTSLRKNYENHKVRVIFKDDSGWDGYVGKFPVYKKEETLIVDTGGATELCGYGIEELRRVAGPAKGAFTSKKSIIIKTRGSK